MEKEKTIQTEVSQAVFDAFTAWADEEHGSKAAALREFAEKAPTGESVHTATTNADLEDKIDDLADKIESGVSVRNQNQNQNQQQNDAESDDEDVDLIELYDAELDAEDLPADLTPEHDDDACVRKDFLETVVEDWEETGSVPALNPTHISSDHRPQGGDTPVALGLAIIQHRFGDKISHSSIIDVLSDDNGGLGYTRQYIRENGHAHEVADHLVTDPTNDQKYLLDDDLKLKALYKMEQMLESKIDSMANPMTKDIFKHNAEELVDLHRDALDLAEEVDESKHDVTIPDVAPAINDAGNQIHAERFYEGSRVGRGFNDALDKIEDLPDLTVLRDTTDLDQYITLRMRFKNRVPGALNAVGQALEKLNMAFTDDIGDDLERAREMKDELSDMKSEVNEIIDERDPEFEVKLRDVVEPRRKGAMHLADMAFEVDDVERVDLVEDAIDAVKDLEDKAFKTDDFGVGTGYVDRSLRWDLKDHRDEIVSE